MTPDGVTDLARLLVDWTDVDARAFADRALWAAGASQEPTALPALVLVASTSLLVVVLWIALVALLARLATTAIRWVRAHV